MAEISSDKQLSDLLGEKESAAGLDIGYYLHLLKRYLWLFSDDRRSGDAHRALLGAPAAEEVCCSRCFAGRSAGAEGLGFG